MPLAENPLAPPHFNYVDYRIKLWCYGLKISVLLISHRSDLQSCRFVHFPFSVFVEEIVGWVKSAKQKNVKNLSLECAFDDIIGTLKNPLFLLDPIKRRSKPNFPQGIFSGLCSLELNKYTMVSSKPFEGCNNRLKTLILKTVIIDDETLNEILEKCRALENFSLVESFGFAKLRICNPNLKILQLYALELDEIVVFAESIVSLLHRWVVCQSPALCTCRLSSVPAH